MRWFVGNVFEPRYDGVAVLPLVYACRCYYFGVDALKDLLTNDANFGFRGIDQARSRAVIKVRFVVLQRNQGRSDRGVWGGASPPQ